MAYVCILLVGYYFLPGPRSPAPTVQEPPPVVFPPQPEAIVKAPAPNVGLSLEPQFKSLQTTRPDSARIAIIIDDVGMDRKHSLRAGDLPAPVTLAFLPYAPDLTRQTAQARQQGHRLMIHMPMQANDATRDPGPVALRAGMSADEMRAQMEKAFESFSGYGGMNNHMGSRMTQDRAAMDVVMESLKARGLFFVDSKTGPHSIAFDAAQAAGVAYGARDVFLDHVETPEFVAHALDKLEAKARQRGYAIAIGHPKAVTLAALEAWIPTLEEKGFVLVPVETLVRVPHAAQPKPDYSDSESVEP